jgi:hypothetical protein
MSSFPLRHARVLAGVAVSAAGVTCAAEYVLPTNGDNIISRNSTAMASQQDTLFDVARRNGVGYEEIWPQAGCRSVAAGRGHGI